MNIIILPGQRSKFKYYWQKGLAEFFNTSDPLRTFMAALPCEPLPGKRTIRARATGR